MYTGRLLMISAWLFIIVGCQYNEGQIDKVVENEENIIVDMRDPNVIADHVMNAMGGLDKWQDLKYVSWTFFGKRHLVWDKQGQRVRIENPKDSSIYLLNMKTKKGKYQQGNNIVLVDSFLTKKMEDAYSIWVNDMYWLFMPFKLKDEGVNLDYAREDMLSNGDSAMVLRLTFENVGLTPGNKYEIFIDASDNLVKRWDFYDVASQDSASASWAWDNYQDFNGLKLSTNRSDNTGPSNVKVYDHLDDEVFTSLASFEFY